MVNRVGGPRAGAPLPGGSEPIRISKELKESVADTKAVAQKLVFTRGQKTGDYTKGPVDGKTDRKADSVFKNHLPK